MLFAFLKNVQRPMPMARAAPASAQPSSLAVVHAFPSTAAPEVSSQSSSTNAPFFLTNVSRSALSLSSAPTASLASTLIAPEHVSLPVLLANSTSKMMEI